MAKQVHGGIGRDSELVVFAPTAAVADEQAASPAVGHELYDNGVGARDVLEPSTPERRVELARLPLVRQSEEKAEQRKSGTA